MRWRLGTVMLGMLSLVLLLSAQNNCPEGFRSAGVLMGSGSYGVAFDERRQVNLPEQATIDTSYQQKRVRARGGNSRAKSDMQAKDIPKGILIIPYGSTRYDNGWAVSAPELKMMKTDDPEAPTRYVFGMRLYCISSSSASEALYGGCDVNVEVCYKPKH